MEVNGEKLIGQLLNRIAELEFENAKLSVLVEEQQKDKEEK